MYSAILRLKETSAEAHLLPVGEELEIHMTKTPHSGENFRFFVQDHPWVTSEVLLVEYSFDKDDNEVRTLHTKNSTYELTNLDDEGYNLGWDDEEEQSIIEFTFDDDDWV